MFGIFKKKTEVEKLQKKFKSLVKQAYIESTKDRKKSDQLAFEANEILNQIETLTKNQENEKK
tara:strand:- start:916 stop:1104 length:189 start_codon:yes stop_codon:yes gene_type:complete